MRQTFFVIPPSWIDPLVIIWILIGIGVLAYVAAKKGIGNDFWGTLPVFVIGALILKFLVPQIMIQDPETEEVLGLAIRGYGFFLLLGVLSGVGLAMHRSRQMGLNPDTTLNLCFWLFAAGIVGARAFYVLQYWQHFQVDGSVSLAKVINMTEGGLVVYGSIIGGAIGGIIFLWLKKLPVLPILDILAPCMMIGLSIGRMGCLMNGCCWGGICEDSSLAIQFPEASPPYARHVDTGALFGMKAPPTREDDPEAKREIVSVVPGSPADQAGIKPGDQIVAYYYSPNQNDGGKLPEEIIYQIEGQSGLRKFRLANEQIPARSLPVHPSQIYSSINAFFVFLFLWFYFPSRKRDGQVFALLMIVYPMGRFLLEMIRSDELGQFGTQLTISQWTSIASIAGGIALLVYGFFYLRRTETLNSAKNPAD